MIDRFDEYVEEKNHLRFIQYDLEARQFDEGGESFNLKKAVELYKKAAIGHIAHAETRLGHLYASNQNELGGLDAFFTAINYYTMAVEDGDFGYSLVMADALTVADPLDIYTGASDNGLNKPQQLALNAAKGDIRARLFLSVYYWKIAKNNQRALECLYYEAKRGDLFCYWNIADMLFSMDDDAYNESPKECRRYYQPKSWIEIGLTKLIGYFGSRSIFDEQLIVHSKESLEDVFYILEFLLTNYSEIIVPASIAGQDCRIIDMVANLYARIVSTSNSFTRGIDKNYNKSK